MLAPGFQGLGRHALGKGNLPFHLGVGALQFLVKVHGDVLDLAAFGLDADGAGHLFQLDGVLDLVVLNVAVDHFPEQVEHAHAVVGVGGAAGGHHAGEVTGHDGVDGGAADADLAVGVLGVQAAGAHGAVLAAGRVRADGAGLHVDGPVKSGLDAVALGLFKHLDRGVAGRQVPEVDLLFLFRDDFFFFCHNCSLRGEVF